MTLEVDLDPVPGWGDKPEDWVTRIQRDGLAGGDHYRPELRVLSTEVRPYRWTDGEGYVPPSWSARAGGGRPRTDLRPALAVLAEHGTIRTSGDMGRALDPALKAEKACSLGRNRLEQLVACGWAERRPMGGWTITERGSDAVAPAT